MSLWRRFRHFLGGGSADAAEEERPAGEAAGGEDESSFSMLNLRDRVVVMLLFDQVVHVDQVGAAWRYWKDPGVKTPDTLWRVVALLPGVDRDAVYAQAARVYAFEPVDFNIYGARALVRKRRSAFARKEWRRMVDLNVAPVHTDYDGGKGTMRWVFATHDPARSSVKRLLAALSVTSPVLRYAPQEQVEDVLDDAFPQWARERAKPPLLPSASGKATTKRESRPFLKAFAHGSSFVEAALREADDEPGSGAERSSPQAEGRDADKAGPHGAPPALSGFFDDVLVGMVQAGAQGAYLFGDARGRLAVYYQQHRKVRHWRTEAGISAEAMIDFVSGRVLSLRSARERPDEAVEHWVGHRRIDFQPTIEPAHGLPEALPVDGDTEVIIIEVLR